MKRKIFSLIICVACLLAVLASCGDVECDAHVDADKNALCDNCSIPVITVTEKVPTEETVVDTVVNVIPQGATYGDVYVVEAPDYAVIPEIAETAKVEGEIYNYYNGFVAIHYANQTAGEQTEEDRTDDEYALTYRLYNPVTAQNVIVFNYDYKVADGQYVNEAEFSVVSEAGTPVLIKVTTTEWEKDEYSSNWRENTFYSYYTFAGVKVADSKTLDTEAMEDKGDDADPIYLPFNFEVDKVAGDLVYVTYNDTKIAIDYEAGSIVASGDAASFIERPVFDAVIGTTGYISKNGYVYIYDLNEWIKCVYAYEIPTSDNTSVFYLENGNILLQTVNATHVDTKNYDALNNGVKVDIDYFVFDVAAKTAAEVEFGYYIIGVETAGDNYKDTVKNVITANVINNKNIGKTVVLAADNALNIIANEAAVIPEFGLVKNLTAVADGVLLGTLYYGEGSSVRVLYKADGTEIAKLPNNAQVKSSFIVIGGKYYDFNMNLKFDPKADAENEFTVYYESANYIIFSNGDDYYYWNASMTAPTLLVDVESDEEAEVQFTASIIAKTAGYVVVKKNVVTVVDNVPETTTTYTVYNANGEAVYTGEDNVTITAKTLGEDTYWVIELPEDVFYIVK